MSRAKNYFAWQARLVVPELGQRVVEAGCGTGNFTGKLLDRELVISVDTEPACVERLKQRYSGHPNLQAFICDAAGAEFQSLARFQPDSCVCLNVIEHIEDDCGALESMASILVPRGVIVLIVPAFPALYGPIDEELGHFRRYTRRSLLNLAKATGLTVEKLHYMNAVGFFGWWANARLFHRQAQSPEQIDFFDRYVVPVISRLESVMRPPFGQSLFAVLRK